MSVNRDKPPAMGVVLRDEGSSLVVDIGGEEVACIVRKSLRRATPRGRKTVVVGDRVHVEFSGEGAAIREVEERRSVLSRPNPGNPRVEQLIVANVDAVLVVASARDPEFAPGLVDRFLVAAEARELQVAIAINKCDLEPDLNRKASLAASLRIYRDLGYEVLEVSARTGAGLEEVRRILTGRTTTLLGHSGVGKSSLANALDPSLKLRTGEVHANSGQGMHTTTTVSLLRLPWGGYLVDTPGIREFGLWQIELPELGHYYRDIARLLPECRFGDCLHEKEPGCAVMDAVRLGALGEARYDSYRRVLEAMREEQRQLDY